MLFKVLSPKSTPPREPRGTAYLNRDRWNDWFEFVTQFHLSYVDDDGNRIDIGDVKIAKFGMGNSGTTELEDSFDELDNEFFSLGQDESYYDNLNKLTDSVRDDILKSLRDLASNATLLKRALKEYVTRRSLLRYVNVNTVEGQFRRISQGGARLTSYHFEYTAPADAKATNSRLAISFDVEPESNPPTNLHVLIGRNGVGKTYLLTNMIQALISKTSGSKFGKFSTSTGNAEKTSFANLVSVSFSAFDDADPIEINKQISSTKNPYTYIGLKHSSEGKSNSDAPKNPNLLQEEFVESIKVCLTGAKIVRWRRALEILEADPIFKEADVSSLTLIKGWDKISTQARSTYKKLSSGHKIVLLTLTRLVETVEEKSLVLIDEPEAHLHPPLLSAFTRVLSDLLVNRNGVAIIATHSPVVLQEVPKSCVWRLRRNGAISVAERLETESFGENVGALTREVFGLEVTHSGFHKTLIDAVSRQGSSYESILELFGNQLGLEARALIRALIATKISSRPDEKTE